MKKIFKNLGLGDLLYGILLILPGLGLIYTLDWQCNDSYLCNQTFRAIAGYGLILLGCISGLLFTFRNRLFK